ncbi:transactivation protein Trap [Macroptilium mosaic Puerto Rico virus]|uniref:Transcriptional activator protein n=1 Tax=Macroptilium mosaic Puerto Rico virus TaxID=223282 RepID=Q8JNH9_9GEMI|nr:transactivation protein Trap [Macroptilium mosaic Puerto Rico virus]AAL05273.1 transactivation protein Trap [Macroptilium mosaic Puerto Rico virus]
MTGHRKTPSTSPLRNHSTPPSIKPRHRHAKRQTRRRRLDLECGCSIYIHISCANHGFTHRGTHHCSSSNEWRFYLGDYKSPLFQNNQRGEANVHEQHGVRHSNPSQPQPEESVGSPQSLLQFPSLDDIDDSFWADLFK